LKEPKVSRLESRWEKRETQKKREREIKKNGDNGVGVMRKPEPLQVHNLRGGFSPIPIHHGRVTDNVASLESLSPCAFVLTFYSIIG